MGIFSRIGDIMKANVNDLIDKAEDPEKMVKQIIRDLQQEVAKSTQALGKAMASQRIAERQYKTALQSSADWESKAKAALAAGNTEMAIRSRQIMTLPLISRCMKPLPHRPMPSGIRLKP